MLKQPVFTCIALMMPLFIFSQVPAGAIARYPLNTNANDVSGNGYNGTFTSVTATTNRFSTANTASAFVAGVSTGTLPAGLVTAVQDNFSIGFWFRTSMVASTSTQWYGGNALVDAEVCGQTNDWGTALIDGGKVSFGVGNPDITIKSTVATYNNNLWHFVTVTRDKTTSAIVLYVDGTQVASTTSGNTGSLAAPASIGLGRNPCAASGVYTGSLDDVIVFNRVLTATEVSNMFVALGAVALPVKWISFTGELSGNDIRLAWEVEQATGNDHYEVEHATDGFHFSVEGIVEVASAVSNTGGRLRYNFTSTHPAGGTHFYRIKQVDKDGASAYSTTIKMMARTTAGGWVLQTNPVVNELVLVNQQQQLIQRLQVTDISGRVLRTRLLNTSNTRINVPLATLKPGYYLLQVITGNGSGTTPFIKQ